MYFLEQKVPIICLQPFLETIRFVIFRTDINFSKGNHMFLESECLRGEQVAVHSDSYINKKVIRFFFFKWNIIRCIIWKGAKLSFSDSELFPSDDFHRELLCIKWACVFLYFAVENHNSSHYRTRCCYISPSIKAETVTQLTGPAVSASAVVFVRKGKKLLCSILKAAARVPFPPGLDPSSLTDSHWFWWALGLVRLFHQQLSDFTSLSHKH